MPAEEAGAAAVPIGGAEVPAAGEEAPAAGEAAPGRELAAAEEAAVEGRPAAAAEPAGEELGVTAAAAVPEAAAAKVRCSGTAEMHNHGCFGCLPADTWLRISVALLSASPCPAAGGCSPAGAQGRARGRGSSQCCAGSRRRAHHPCPPQRGAARTARSPHGGCSASRDQASGGGGGGCSAGGGRRARRQGEQQSNAHWCCACFCSQIEPVPNSLPLLPLLQKKKKGRGPWHKLVKEVKKVGYWVLVGAALPQSAWAQGAG